MFLAPLFNRDHHRATYRNLVHIPPPPLCSTLPVPNNSGHGLIYNIIAFLTGFEEWVFDPLDRVCCTEEEMSVF